MPVRAAHQSGIGSQPAFKTPVLVAHVKRGYEDRRRSIERQLGALGMPFEFMLDGDIADIDAELTARWFSPAFGPGPAQSCACKHLLMFERLSQAGWSGALILEDDIFLAEDFVAVFDASLEELRSRNPGLLDTAWISYENTGHKRPSRRDLRPGQLLYPNLVTRCMGAYYIGRGAAQSLLQLAESRKVDRAIDAWVEDVAGLIPESLQIYWCHPAVAEQGSMNGQFDSMDPRRRASPWRRFKWTIDKWYKSLKHRVS